MDHAPHAPHLDPSVADLIAGRPWLARHPMQGLLLEEVPLAAIAAAAGTPTWVVSASEIRRRLDRLAGALAERRAAIHFAVKANDHLAVLRVMAGGGAGADVVSGGELARARQAGIAPGQIVFSGVGKTRAELAQAIAEGIAQINVESAEELQRIAAVAAACGAPARVALRVNPDVDARTNAKITTGLAENKFGIPYDDIAALYAHAATLPGVQPVGLAVHIGSQIGAMAPYRDAFARVATLVRDLRAAGQGVATVDCGGGLGIAYRDEQEASPEAFAAVLRATLGDLDLGLSVEPGRWLIGPAGLLLASVVLVKNTAHRRFVVLDAAMNDLVRPAMYDAWHGIVPVGAEAAARPETAADIVGPVCESGDTFARERRLPPLAEDDLVAILDAGAYGAVMSSTYNARPLAAQVMVDGGNWAVIRARQEPQALWAGETVPDFA